MRLVALRWTIATDTPGGHVRFSFPERETSPHADMIEWSPAPNERENLLRYTLKFEEQNSATVIDVSHHVELRRKRAWDLHPGVGLMGETRLSNALQRRINEAIEGFLERVKEKRKRRPSQAAIRIQDLVTGFTDEGSLSGDIL